MKTVTTNDIMWLQPSPGNRSVSARQGPRRPGYTHSSVREELETLPAQSHFIKILPLQAGKRQRTAPIITEFSASGGEGWPDGGRLIFVQELI